MQRILITGAAGFIGFALAHTLSGKPDCELFIVDNFIRGERDEDYNRLCALENVTAYDLDLTVPGSLGALPEDIDVIFHMAALNGTQNFYERPYDVVRCSTLPTFYLVERYAHSAHLKRFVYAGSSEVYAGTVSTFQWPVPTDENVPMCIPDSRNIRWSYGASKLHGELLLHSAFAQHGLPHTIIRYHNVYGPRMGDKHVIPDFLRRMKAGTLALYGYNDTRSFIYIDDAVRATLLLAESPAAANQTVNVGSPKEIRILDLAHQIMALSGTEGDIQLHPSPSGSVPRRAPDTTKLTALVGFRENWTLQAGLEKTIDYYMR
jgi:UDP-glucose 4-epimerase